MSSFSNAEKHTRSRADSDPSRTTQNPDVESTKNEQPRCRWAVSRSSPTGNILGEGTPRTVVALHDYPLDNGAVDTDHDMMVIESIRATDVALGLGRLPAGFYTAVHHSGREWRTENKRSSVILDLVEWTGPIPIPSNLSAIVSLEVYASFEFQPMLGAGEQLRTLTVTVKELLDRSAEHAMFTFFPDALDVISPCSSISVSIGHQTLPMTRVLLPHRSSLEATEELEDITNQGHRAFSRYQKRGDRRNLELSIAQFERAWSICPLDHPCRGAVQSNLAMAKFVLHQVDGAAASLETVLNMYQDVLRARPIGHIDRPSTLIQFAAVSFVQYHKSNKEVGDIRWKVLLQEALELSAEESHENWIAKFMLQLRTDCWTDPMQCRRDEASSAEQDSRDSVTQDPGELHDLDSVILTQKGSVQVTPDGHPDKPRHLTNLGNSLVNRFECTGDLRDLDNAISTHKDAVQLIPDDHPDKPSCLNSLCDSLRTRFELLTEPRDIDDAIFTHRNAIQLIPDDHADKPGYLTILGLSLHTRFERLRERHVLEDALSILKDAVQLTPDSHPDKYCCLNNLGRSLRTRFERSGELHDLDNAISSFKDAVQLIPDGHPDKPYCLSNLGHSLHIRFLRLGELRNIDDAISSLRDTVRLTPDSHPDKPSRLDHLCLSLHARFERLGKRRDLEDALSTLRDAVLLTPDGHPDKPCRLGDLGNSLHIRFLRLGELCDLEDALSTLNDAVKLTPNDHPNKPCCLNYLGLSLRTRFERLGEYCDLANALRTLEDAVQLTPSGHPAKSGFLINLGLSLHTRFLRLGERRDLEDALSTLKDAVQLTPDGHPDKPRRLTNLGAVFRARFSSLGELRDLDGAILTLREAVHLTPDGHPDESRCLTNLGNSLVNRFERLRELRDLDDAISAHWDAVQVIHDDHPDKPGCLNNLGNSLRVRFEHLGERCDLDDAISTHGNTVQLIPDNHADKPGYLTNFGLSLHTRFERLGDHCDLEDALSILKDAVRLTPDGHPNKSRCLNNLGISLVARFKHFGDHRDLSDAISTYRNVVQLTPDGHPDKPACLTNLGSTLFIRYEHSGKFRDLEGALSAYSHAAFAPFGSIRTRFRASRNWISCAHRLCHHSLLRAYSVSISLLPQLAWIGLPLEHRYTELRRGAGMVRQAAAAALDAGFPELAVEWLEQGRSIVWGALLQLRNPYKELASAHPDHAHRFREISTALDNASATREKSLSSLSLDTSGPGTVPHMPEILRQEADRHRALAIERDDLLKEIRRLPGFDGFLRYTTFSQLRASAHAGPVVILNAAESRCDALIVLANVDHVVHVPLPNFTLQRSADLQSLLTNLIRREGQSMKCEGVGWEVLLPQLWKCIVKPVLDASAFSIPGDPSRIFWCPTGPLAFLPFHAAGLYDDQFSQHEHKVFNFVVSSYTPSLAILALPPSRTTLRNDSIRLLAVRQPATDGKWQLPGARIELEHIRDAVQYLGSVHTTLVEPSVGTVEEVLSLMEDADWVHFACHGVQDGINSGLCLADQRRLKVRDIIALSRPRSGLAFLSACQTAMGEKQLSDEAIHIAAGMLFAGYGGVIGTMWSISDTLAPGVARDVYRRLFREDKRPDYREAAYALHDAIGDLRDSIGASFDDWIPFIHVGL